MIILLVATDNINLIDSFDEQSKHENIFLYGVNSSGENIHISLKWRPQEDATSKAHVKLYLKDTKGDVYTLDEEDQVEMGKDLKEYKVAGIAFEMLSPMKRYSKLKLI